jgi:hypothetical protein
VEAARQRGVGVVPADVFAVHAGAGEAAGENGSATPDAVRLCIGGAADVPGLRWALDVLEGLLRSPRETATALA